MIKIRPATIDDAERIWTITKKAWVQIYAHPNNPYGIEKNDLLKFDYNGRILSTKEKILHADGSSRKYWVACDGSTVVGFVCTIKNSEEWRIKSLYVHPSYQGQRIGEKLLKRALEYLGHQNIGGTQRSVILGVAKHNHRAIKFYEKHGFKSVMFSEHMFTFSQEDVVIYSVPIIDMKLQPSRLNRILMEGNNE